MIGNTINDSHEQLIKTAEALEAAIISAQDNLSAHNNYDKISKSCLKIIEQIRNIASKLDILQNKYELLYAKPAVVKYDCQFLSGNENTAKLIKDLLNVYNAPMLHPAFLFQIASVLKHEDYQGNILIFSAGRPFVNFVCCLALAYRFKGKVIRLNGKLAVQLKSPNLILQVERNSYQNGEDLGYWLTSIAMQIEQYRKKRTPIDHDECIVWY